MFKHAITRLPGADLGQGLTTAALGAPDHALALRQHALYVAALRELDLAVEVLPALPGCPDAYFVEDPAVVLPEAAIICRPAIDSRRGEVASIADALRPLRALLPIEPPGTLEGGDVLQIEDHFYVGISQRTNRAGAEQFGQIVTRHGFRWTPLPLPKGLHLKTDVTYLGDGIVLITAGWAEHPAFACYRHLVVPEEEVYAANALRINGAVVMAEGFPRTLEMMSTLGLPIITLDVSEPRKMDGGLSCMSLRF